MTLHRSNPGLWLSFGKSVRPAMRQRFQRDGRSGPGALRPLAAGPRSRLALAAALVVATFLSPGASGACAGCCDDVPPTVVAPLAAGIAPVHTAASVAAAPHRCCHAAAGDTASMAGSCCSDAAAETAGCETPADQTEPCGCRPTPRDSAPAVPVRTQTDDLRVAAAGIDSVFTANALDAGRMSVAFDGTVLPTHARPLRVLYGVWRN
jgi:hypothetical protein